MITCMKKNTAENHYHTFIMSLCVAVLLFSFSLSIRSDTGVSLFALKGHDVHGFCFFEQVLGIPCPSCGLTRAFISISHLQFKEALHYNAACVLIYLIVVFQIPFRVLATANSRYLSAFERFKAFRTAYFSLTVVVLFAGWLYRLFVHYMV